MTVVRTNYPSISSLFDDIFSTELGDWRRKNYSSTDTSLPKVNIREDDLGFAVEMAAPGMSKSDFDIQLDNQVLTVSSEKKLDDREDESRYTKREFSYQSFSRAFNLPETADGERIKAKYQDGILVISIPKKEEARPQPAKTINIS